MKLCAGQIGYELISGQNIATFKHSKLRHSVVAQTAGARYRFLVKLQAFDHNHASIKRAIVLSFSLSTTRIDTSP